MNYVLDCGQDEVYDAATDNLVPTGKVQTIVRGTRRAYAELARYLLTLVEMSGTGVDKRYHDHFDFIRSIEGEEAVHLIIHLPTGP